MEAVLDHEAGQIAQEKDLPQAWEDPIGFDDYKLPKFDTSIFPTWLRDYVEGVSESTQTPRDASGIAAISILSTILSRKYEVKVVGDWVETLNTYTVMALASANRKSSVSKSFIQPIMDYEKEQVELLRTEVAKQKDWLRAKEKRIEKLEKDYAKDNDQKVLNEIYTVREEIEAEEIITIPSFITADATPEKIADLMAKNNEKIAILSAEGAEAFQMMAGRYSNDKASNIDIYLKGHSADNVSIDRMGRESIKLHNPTLTVGLFVQPSIIRDLPDNFQDRGLTQRFLYSFPTSKVGYREIEPNQMDRSVKDEFLTNMDKLLRIKISPPSPMATDEESFQLTACNEPIQLTFDEEAGRYEVYLRTQIEDMLKDGDITDGFQGWLGKLSGQIIRIAGLLHVAEYVGREIPSEINVETLEKANVLREYFIQHAKKAHGVMGVNENDEDAKYILKKITEKCQDEEVIDHQKIWQTTKRKLKEVQNLDIGLANLEERNFIRNEVQGRKKIIYINPLLFNTPKSVPNSPNDG